MWTKKLISEPRDKALSNLDILKLVKKYKIPFFRGVYMRDNLPMNGPKKNESIIINLDDKNSAGTHWVAMRKRGDIVHYFDSYGDLTPPNDLVKYLHSKKSTVTIFYNYNREQWLPVECGHLAIEFLQTPCVDCNFLFKKL